MVEQVLGKPQGRKIAGQIRFFRGGGGVGEGDMSIVNHKIHLSCDVLFFSSNILLDRTEVTRL